MSGDFSRLTFDPSKRYSAVRMQQGRVQLDSDWNEQMDILMHRLETEVGDFLGADGAPAEAAGFAVTVAGEGNELRVGPGRYYVAGKLFESDAELPFVGQPDFPRAALPEEPGRYVAYLDAWQRHVSADEDPQIREVALGGADTTTRVRNIWQVRLERLADDSAQAPAELRRSWRPSRLPIGTGTLRARVGAELATLENQLYRVEVHEAGDNYVTLKWSRDNGSVTARVLAVSADGRAVTVREQGRDSLARLADGQWVELLTEADLREGEPGFLLRVGSATPTPEGAVLFFSELAPMAEGTVPPFVVARRWDMPATQALLPSFDLDESGLSPWIPLESEIAVQLAWAGGAGFRAGDHWLIAARTLTGGIEWPRGEDGPALRAPHGTRHYYVPLALLERDGAGAWRVAEDGDLRATFRPLTSGLVNKAGDTMDGALRITPPASEGDALRVDGKTLLDGDVRVGGEITNRDGETAVMAGATVRVIHGTISAEGGRVAGSGFEISRPEQQGFEEARARHEQAVQQLQEPRSKLQAWVNRVLETTRRVEVDRSRILPQLNELEGYLVQFESTTPSENMVTQMGSTFNSMRRDLMDLMRVVMASRAPSSAVEDIKFRFSELISELEDQLRPRIDTASNQLHTLPTEIRAFTTDVRQFSHSTDEHITFDTAQTLYRRLDDIVLPRLNNLNAAVSEMAAFIKSLNNMVQLQNSRIDQYPQDILGRQYINVRALLVEIRTTANRMHSIGQILSESTARLAGMPSLSTNLSNYGQSVSVLREDQAGRAQFATLLPPLEAAERKAAEELENARREATGSYRIIFQPPFAGPPTLTASALRDPGDNTLVIAVLEAVGPESADVYCAGLDNSVKNRAFNFIAVGPR